MSRAETPSADRSLPILDGKPTSPPAPVVATPIVALAGNPNTGKSSLFNRLSGLRAHTANFAGTTVEHRRATVPLGDATVELIDLPGLYTLDATIDDERVASEILLGRGPVTPDAVVLVIDATNLERNLFLASQVLETGRETSRPMVVALNMADIAERHGLRIDAERLAADLDCPVVPVSARTGAGLDDLRMALVDATQTMAAPQADTVCACTKCNGCVISGRHDWAETITRRAVTDPGEPTSRRTERLDRVLAHRWWGLAAFAVVMLATFWLIYSLAAYPMEWIETLIASAGGLVGGWLPEGDFQSLLVDGVIGGAGAVLVFLPQIAILFLLLALLEDSGYLARATFVMDRLMQKVGLPGKAFVPMLSAHACAIPAIMASRVIEDRRDRLATILVLPLMTCSARVPVYAMVIALLFPTQPLVAATVFTSAYALGIAVALVMAWVFKRTILPGESRPLVIELPNYKPPSLRDALLLTFDRSKAFITNAGTTILLIAIALWAMATYPKTALEDLPTAAQAEIRALETAGDAEAAGRLLDQYALERSLAGRLGRGIQPVFEPLGFDWRMSVGVVTSFAAREVVVSTLSVLFGMGDEAEGEALTDRLATAKRAGGAPVFTTASSLSLLVFYVLAMQCLPTQVVTKRETGSWKWAGLQFGYMTALAYLAALVTYQSLAAFGLA